MRGFLHGISVYSYVMIIPGGKMTGKDILGRGGLVFQLALLRCKERFFEHELLNYLVISY
jgi:hypothetical protein